VTDFPGFGGIADLLKHAREMGKQVGEVRERLRRETFSASVGGDLVKATVNGEGEVLRVEIDDALLTSDDREMLEDLVAAAVNGATKKSRDRLRQEMSRLTGGIDVAGILGLS